MFFSFYEILRGLNIELSRIMFKGNASNNKITLYQITTPS